jgi:hypothetical protein
MLRQAERTWLATNSSARPASWASINEYNNEYLAISDPDVLSKVFNVFEYRAPCDQKSLIPTQLWGTIFWGQSAAGPLPFTQLVSRPKLTKWLFFTFFRLAIPYYRDTAEAEYPLNLTIFFRLMASLPLMGYPMPWLHEVMIAILEDQVLTTTRPPRSCPLALDELELNHPKRRIPTAPFVEEMRTLASIFQRVLPFALVTETLSPPDQIFEYTIKVTFVEAKDDSRPGLILVFISDEFTDIAEHEGEIDLHSMLVFEPSALPKEQADSVLEVIDNGVMIVTTFKLDHAQKSAVLWMKGGVIESMAAAKNWRVGLWRTDDWQPIATPGRLNRKRIAKGKSWLDTPAFTEPVGRSTQMPPVIHDEPRDHGKKETLGVGKKPADTSATAKDPAEESAYTPKTLMQLNTEDPASIGTPKDTGNKGPDIAGAPKNPVRKHAGTKDAGKNDAGKKGADVSGAPKDPGEKRAGTTATVKDTGKKRSDIGAPKESGEKRGDTVGKVKDSGNKRADITGAPKDPGEKRADTVGKSKDSGAKPPDTVGNPKDHGDRPADAIATPKGPGNKRGDTIGIHKQPWKKQPDTTGTPKEPGKKQAEIADTPKDPMDDYDYEVGGPRLGAKPGEPGFFFF